MVSQPLHSQIEHFYFTDTQVGGPVLVLDTASLLTEKTKNSGSRVCALMVRLHDEARCLDSEMISRTLSSNFSSASACKQVEERKKISSFFSPAKEHTLTESVAAI